ncbi:decarboxylase [Salmonella enterica subsp. arizonae]|uniref:Decarboxylase n=1 Tax=Salmonella enterica subsp. arizonae TaxID=59203 RepID=A0A379T6W8_SALER|nr:decarboxylase [Salmonella enterica subsp. arizonae]
MRLIVGMTGATGAPLGVALLQALRTIPNVENTSSDVKVGEKPLSNWRRPTRPWR